MGIFDHTVSNNPIDLVKVHDNDNFELMTRRCRRMHEYHDCGVYDVFKLDFIQFEQLPVPKAQQMLSMAKKIRRIESTNQFSKLSNIL